MQIDQADQTVDQGRMVEQPSSRLNGQFAPGFSGNPAGAPRADEKITQPSRRIAYLSSIYTSDQILEIAESKFLKSKLPYWDSVYIVWMARALDPSLTKTNSGADDMRGERKELLDRMHGQTKAQTEITGANGAPILPLIKIVFEGNNQPMEPAAVSEEQTPVTIEQSPPATIQSSEEQAANMTAPRLEFE